MTDILVSGVPTIVPEAPASSTAYALATVLGFVFPNKHTNLASKAVSLQTQYNTSEDFTPAQIENTLVQSGVKFINLQPMVDAGDMTTLRHEIASGENQGAIHLIVLNDDSKLAIAVPLATPDANGAIATNGAVLHPWSHGTSYALVRNGYSDSSPWGYYKDPLLAMLPYPEPVPVLWDTIVQCGVAAVFTVLPGTVTEAPQATFRYYAGSGQPDNVWPVPAVKLDAVQLIDDLDLANNMLGSVDGALSDVLNTALGNIPAVIDLCKRTIAQVRASHSKIADDIHRAK